MVIYRIGDTVYCFVDTRIIRTLKFDDKNALLTMKQFEYWSELFKKFTKNDQIQKIIIVTQVLL